MLKDRNKYLMANAMKECMKTMSVEKITVSNIVEACSISRQTFYRNFKDKYDLINWYFDRLVEQSFDQIGTKTTIKDCLVKKLTFIQEERVFFTAAFKSEDYNSVKEHDFRLILGYYQKLIAEQGYEHLSHELESLLEMYCQASVYMTAKWIVTGMNKGPEEMSNLLVDAIPPKLGAVLYECNLLSSF